MENKIQNYAWGSVTAIPDLLRIDNPDREPMAEMWMGAHPKAPSLVRETGGKTTGLDDLVARDPAAVLGPQAAKRFNSRLPFLFKVLAAETPLSIQAHPNLQQAASGYRRENDVAVPLDAFNRNYKDDNHKPEIICALTEYVAMRGFRSAAQIADNFSRILIDDLRLPVERLQKAAGTAGAAGDDAAGDDAEGGALRDFFTRLMTLDDGSKAELIDEAKKVFTVGEEGRWIHRLSELYPGDIGIVSPLYLNLVTLQPGEAMYLPAGELHAYLKGLGIELMANSDNVLRGGLTPKHVDVPQLLETLNFCHTDPEILLPEKTSPVEWSYKTPAAEFVLSKIVLQDEVSQLVSSGGGPGMPSIFLCLEGEAVLTDSAGGALPLQTGESALATFGSSVSIKGPAVLFRASLPAASAREGSVPAADAREGTA